MKVVNCLNGVPLFSELHEGVPAPLDLDGLVAGDLPLLQQGEDDVLVAVHGQAAYVHLWHSLITQASENENYP